MRHTGSSFLGRDRTQAPCIGSTEAYPLDHQGSPKTCRLFKKMGMLLIWGRDKLKNKQKERKKGRDGKEMRLGKAFPPLASPVPCMGPEI